MAHKKDRESQQDEFVRYHAGQPANENDFAFESGTALGVPPLGEKPFASLREEI
jgi:hypothetical protein